MPYAERRLGRGGFTLVELAVAMLIGGILISVVFQMMVGQTRVAAVQSGREEVQQNTRGALEIVSSELRSALPGGLLEAGSQSLTFMQPRAFGILCTSTGPGADNIDVLVPATAPAAAWAASDANGVLVQPVAAGAWTPARGPTLAATLSNRARIVTSQAGAAANCAGLAAAGNVQVVNLGLSTGVNAVQGAVVALYTLTRYDVAAVNGQTWLRRNSGISSANEFNQQPLAGPLAVDPLRFGFFYEDGAGNPIAAPGANEAVLNTVARVRVRVVTTSTQQVNGHAQRDSGEAVVQLRNN